MLRRFLVHRIKTFPPVYFALPMSTGIMSVASFTLGYNVLSTFFYVLCGIELSVLFMLFLLKAIFFYSRFRKGFSVPGKAGGTLTLIAAISIFSMAGILLYQNFKIAVTGWRVSIVLWLMFIYIISALTIIEKKKPGIRNSINGSWLLFVVSAQALAILGNFVMRQIVVAPEIGVFITLSFYFIGALFYLIIIALISYRYAFYRLRPREFRPSYWINMGAAAISTLSGSILIETMRRLGVYQDFIPLFKVFTFLFWIGATWWIPLILYLEIWKRLIVKVSYKPENWSLVFPLGVYTVCTWHFGKIMNLDFLMQIPHVSIFVAFAAWIILYVKMFYSRIRVLKAYRKRS